MDRAGDCAPDDEARHPGANDVCVDALDGDCDGVVDACWDQNAEDIVEQAHVWWAGGAGDGLRALDWQGDLDGDGVGDLVLGAPRLGAGRVAVVSGPEIAGPLTDARWIDGLEPGDGFGSGGTHADLDGDGWPDLVVASPGALGGAGAIDLLWGPAPALEASVRLQAPGPGDGLSVVHVGDAAGSEDGVAVLVPAWSSGATLVGGVWLIGSVVGPGTVAGVSSAEVRGAVGAELRAVAATDVNGDGWDDVVIAAGGVAVGFPGPVSGTLAVADAAWQVPCAGGLDARDVDNDGYGDVVTGAPDAGVGGAVSVWVGPPAGGGLEPLGVLTGQEDGAGVGEIVRIVGRELGGVPDVVAAGSSLSEVQAWREVAWLLYLASSAAPHWSQPTGVLGEMGVTVVGDVNDDGRQDVAFSWPDAAGAGLGGSGLVAVLLGTP